ncbi:PAS domain S-box protein [Phenylobacterium sp.]|jgi:PAS domain S-box-containing protein|uniref:PAS domain S-box protein n=1 Tax=Phenylobacterium sp. TaxID=1871053 RepID=UPI0037837408
MRQDGTVAELERQVASARDALVQSEERYRSVLATMPEGFCIIELIEDGAGTFTDYRYLDVNPAFERHTGLTHAAGRLGSELSPGDEAVWLDIYGTVARTGRSIRFEDHHQPTGRWYDVHASRVGDGARPRVCIVFTDITDGKRANRRRDEAESEVMALAERHREVLESISDAFYAVDADWRFAYVNRRAEEWWGRSRADLLGKPIWDEFPAAVGSAAYDAHQRAARTRQLVRTETVSPILGHWVDISVYPAADGGLAVYFRDITETKRAELSLRESQARLAAQKEAFQIAMDGGDLAASLGALFRGTKATTGDRRCAFYIVDDATGGLHHVTGMSPAYAEAVDGFVISPESVACGLAVALGKPVITPDVLEDPQWKDWLWLAQAHDYRGCWSFPIETASGRLVGSLAFYFREPREPEPADQELAAVLTQTAAIIISHYQETEERARSEARFRQFAEASSDALWIRDARTLAMEYVSPAFETVYGAGRGAMSDEGGLDPWALLIVSEDREAALARLDEVRRGLPAVHEYRIQRPSDGAERWIRAHDFPLLDDEGRVQRIGGIATDVTEARQSRERQAVLLHELQHRVRNTLAVVRSIASSTRETSDTVEDFSSHLQGRLDALARTQLALTRVPGSGVDLDGLVRDELLAQVASESQVLVDGPTVRLPPKAAEVLTLAVHELGVNAMKYGALSTGAGRVDVRWETFRRDDKEWLRLVWQEGGVAIASSAPRRQGFGTELIEQRVPYELRGRGVLAFRPGGVRCEIEFPLNPGDSILRTDPPPSEVHVEED